MNSDLPADAEETPPPRRPLVERITGWLAVLGGLLALGVALLVTASVLGRWLFNAPIDGDFEFVKMATAIAVFAYLPYTQARRHNIVVDTFTTRLSPRTCARIDAVWDLVYAGAAAFTAYALTYGTFDSLESGETTMQRQIPLWPSIAIAAVFCGVLTITAIITAVRLQRASHGGGDRR